MKKLFLFLIFLFLLSSCSNEERKEINSIYLTSDLNHQIQNIHELRWDLITYEIEFVDGSTKNNVLTPRELVHVPSEVGLYTLQLKRNSSICEFQMYLYDEQYIKDKVLIQYENEDKIELSLFEKNKSSLENEENHHFLGWYSNNEYITEEYLNQMNQSTIILEASYTQNTTYQVRFYSDDILLKTQNVLEGSNAIAPVIKSNSERKFLRWDKDFSNIHSSIDVRAVYDSPIYTVEILDLDGNSIESNTYEYGEYISIDYSIPSTDEYTFIGWSKDNFYVSSDVVITPKIEYTYDYYKEFDQIIKVPYNSSYTPSELEGYFVDEIKKVFNEELNRFIYEVIYEKKQFIVEIYDYYKNIVYSNALLYGSNALDTLNIEDFKLDNHEFLGFSVDLSFINSNSKAYPLYDGILYPCFYYEPNTKEKKYLGEFFEDVLPEAPVYQFSSFIGFELKNNELIGSYETREDALIRFIIPSPYAYNSILYRNAMPDNFLTPQFIKEYFVNISTTDDYEYYLDENYEIPFDGDFNKPGVYYYKIYAKPI